MDDVESLTIVVGYDGSDSAQRGLTRVRGLGERAAHLLVITVTPDLRSAGLGSQLADRTFDGRQLTEEALNLLDVSAERAVETRTPTGDPAEVLVETAREIGADLLVVGRQGGDFVARTLLGSVAQRVVQHAPCDVLVVA